MPEKTWTLDLFGNTVTVKLVPQGDPAIQGRSGLMCRDLQIILLGNDMAPDQMRSTLLHEIIEWIGATMGLQLDERTILSLETGLFECLTRNGVDFEPLLGDSWEKKYA